MKNQSAFGEDVCVEQAWRLRGQEGGRDGDQEGDAGALAPGGGVGSQRNHQDLEWGRHDSQAWDLNADWVMVPFPETGGTGGGRGCPTSAEFELSLRHPSVQWRVEYRTWSSGTGRV